MPQVSKATEYNWRKLNSDSQNKLTMRANKTQSKKRVVATNYLDYAPANNLLQIISNTDAPIENIMYSLCVSYLNYCGILSKRNVQKFISQYRNCHLIDFDVPEGIWQEGKDVIGFIYQSIVTEGERNLTGQYYTNSNVVNYMLDNKHLADGETFLDPCCGSGAFLLSVQTNTPECLYGFDINPIAVMIAGTNLLAKYSEHNFIPNVFCLDFLKNDLFDIERQSIPVKFDNIYTNPPWGSDRDGLYIRNYPEIKSKERSLSFTDLPKAVL